MGNVSTLGCCGGPDADAFVSAKFYSNVEKPEKSFLDAWQRSWSKSWREIVDASQSTTSSSNKGESVEDPLQWELLRACSSTGSRLLSDFYNLVLERDYDRFFLDEAGNRVTGEYLNRIVIINDYFNPNATHRDDSEAQAMTSEKQTYTDRHSTLSAGSEATAATAMSEESDYWSCMEAMLGQEQLDNECRHSQSEHSSPLLDDTSRAMYHQSPLILFSPVKTGKWRTRRKSKQLSSSWDGPTSIEDPLMSNLKPWEASESPSHRQTADHSARSRFLMADRVHHMHAVAPMVAS